MAYKPKTVVPRAVQAIAHCFWQDSRALPPAAWDKWWKTLAIGLGICAFITYGLTLVAMDWESL